MKTVTLMTEEVVSIEKLGKDFYTGIGGLRDHEYFFLNAALMDVDVGLDKYASSAELLGYRRSHMFLDSLHRFKNVCLNGTMEEQRFFFETIIQVVGLIQTHMVTILTRHGIIATNAVQGQTL